MLNPMPVHTPTHSVVTVGNTTTAVLAANAARTYVLLINDSDEVMYLKVGANAAANAGIRLEANGGRIEISAAQGNLMTGAINGICASGSKKLLVTECVSAA